MLYTRIRGAGHRVLQICSTVHIIAILRIYRWSLINSNKEGNVGRKGGAVVRVREKRKYLYEMSIAIMSPNGCHGNPGSAHPATICIGDYQVMHSTEKKSQPVKKKLYKKKKSEDAATQGYVTSMATVFSDRLFSAGLSCSWFSLKKKQKKNCQIFERWLWINSHTTYIHSVTFLKKIVVFNIKLFIYLVVEMNELNEICCGIIWHLPNYF